VIPGLTDVQVTSLIALTVALFGAGFTALMTSQRVEWQRTAGLVLIVASLFAFVALFTSYGVSVDQGSGPVTSTTRSGSCFRAPLETGPGQTLSWALDVPSGCVVVLEGYRVDGEGPGVFRAMTGPMTRTFTIEDGEIWFTDNASGRNDFCAIVADARGRSVTVTRVEPLPGWQACP
jgi:hypothetical protein